MGGFVFAKKNSQKDNNLSKKAQSTVEVYISDKLTTLHGQSDHLSRRFRSLISERYGR